MDISDLEQNGRNARNAGATAGSDRPPVPDVGRTLGHAGVTTDDERWMSRALELARRGRCGASPNPMVGAVVLDRHGRPAGEGYHARCGGPHAEIVALAEAGERARGGTIFVTLEPCAHHGRTPPCVDALVAAGIGRVVIGIADPNPAAAGGAERLRAEGIEVVEGVGSESGRVLNRRWLRFMQDRRPWVSAKAAVSLDGRIATRTGESKWITGEAARTRSLELREEHDAILVGVGTVLADDPRLTRRLGLNPGDGWLRVVLDSRLRTPSTATIVVSDPGTTVIAHTAAAAPADRERLAATGVGLVELPSDDRGRVSVGHLLDHLGARGVAALLVEGGAAVHGALFDGDLVDEVYFFVAPIVIGGEAPGAVAGLGIAELARARRYLFEEVGRHDDDLELHGVRAEDDGVHRAD
ncbi:MAG: bifunctional diaminohydroxyphosphoribosylaminopyrimidine deaminase/5-amino-6-(5-phosphoribosylamino)uracil reductase RibD [Thermoanaerobaculales bacterium]|nr:bifunctional diaminohydroxyphosphoribosylaminopyrimidine deaminase/5-amino-6-(5-phosphoribosylamino)uracil reductase RibD [Thermoanaerobaculales bacterium]